MTTTAHDNQRAAAPDPTDAFWALVPSLDEAPVAPAGATAGTGAAAPAVGTVSTVDKAGSPAARWTASRRTTLKALGALGGALAINVLSWLPPARQRPAAARVGTEYTNCAGYDSWPGYNNNSAVCVGGTYGSGYCGSDGWFLQYSGTCFSSGAVVACGEGVTKRNAWRWTHSGTPYRCADGMQYWCGGSGFFICSRANP